MKKVLILLAPLLLSGCILGGKQTGLASGPQIPELPTVLAKRAEKLPPNSDTSMGAQVLDNTSNITKYNEVGHQTNAIIDFYNCIRTSINNKKEPKCL